MADPNKLWAKVVAKAWTDGAFKKRLLSDPVGTLRAEGADIPEGGKIRVVEAASNEEIFVIPHVHEDDAKIGNLEQRIAATYWT